MNEKLSRISSGLVFTIENIREALELLQKLFDELNNGMHLDARASKYNLGLNELGRLNVALKDYIINKIYILIDSNPKAISINKLQKIIHNEFPAIDEGFLSEYETIKKKYPILLGLVKAHRHTVSAHFDEEASFENVAHTRTVLLSSKEFVDEVELLVQKARATALNEKVIISSKNELYLQS